MSVFSTNNLLSIIIPTYNRDLSLIFKFISLLDENSDIELIIVDDCSTKDVVYPKHDQIKFLRNKRNLGAGLSRNEGLRIATGEYIFFLDSDDLCNLNQVSKIYFKLIDHPAFDLAVIKLRFISKVKCGSALMIYANPDVNLLTRTLRNGGLSASPVDKIYKKKFLLDNQIFFGDSRSYEDIVWNRKISFYCRRLEIWNDVFYTVHDVSTESVSREVRPRIADLRKVFREEEEFAEECPAYRVFWEDVSKANKMLLIYEVVSFAKICGGYKEFITYLCEVRTLPQYAPSLTKEYPLRYKFFEKFLHIPLIIYITAKSHRFAAYLRFSR